MFIPGIRRTGLRLSVLMVMCLSACAPHIPIRVPDVQPPLVDPMAAVAGDKPLPVLQGVLERIDCTSGKEDLHARIALEARGGQIASFAYYSKWKPRTCSMDFDRNDPKVKWRLMPDGGTRVQTPQGIFVIRARPDSYLFEFQKISRQKFCGMLGQINGTMTILRKVHPPECSVVGVLDANDEYLENLRRLK
jgi:hypothetical protein